MQFQKREGSKNMKVVAVTPIANGTMKLQCEFLKVSGAEVALHKLGIFPKVAVRVKIDKKDLFCPFKHRLPPKTIPALCTSNSALVILKGSQTLGGNTQATET